ncbi:MAG: hypothetical protein KAR42_01890 [candidate division Zixibacteria bacterium]|nr:hypothetical protein [candidate division Zixibacteria bacterium]
MRKTLTLPIYLFVFCLLLSLPAYALSLKPGDSIPLKEKDRVLGNMSGSIMVYGRPNITVYNSRLKAVFSKKVKNNIKPVFSDNGKSFALVTYHDNSPRTLRATKFANYDNRGKFKWHLPKPDATTFEFADNSYIFGIEGVAGISPTHIHVYDEFGDLLNVVTVENYRRVIKPQGGYKFVIDKGVDGLEVFDSSGTSLATLPAADKCKIDKDDRYIATFTNGIFRMFQDERVVQKVRCTLSKIKDFEIDVERNILILLGEKKVEVYNLISGRKRWEYDVKDQKESYTSLDLSDNSDFFVCGIDVNLGSEVIKANRHVEGYICLFRVNGQDMTRQRIAYKNWGVGLPKVHFSESGASIYVQTKDSITNFRIR